MLPKRVFAVSEIGLHLVNACIFSLVPSSLWRMPELTRFVAKLNSVCKCGKTLFRSVHCVKLSFQSGLRARKKNREIAS